MSDEKNYVVVQNGSRVTAALSEQDARKEAERRNKMMESTGNVVPENKQAKAVQNICG